MMRILAFCCALLLWAIPADAQMVVSGVGIGNGHPPAAGGGSFTFTFTDVQAKDDGFVNPTTFTANFGTASSDRLILVGVSTACNSCGVFPTPTIAGITATAVVVGGTNNINGIYAACVPTGTSGTISFAKDTAAVGIVVAAISGQSGGCNTTPTASSAFYYSPVSAQPLSHAITVNSGGASFTFASAIQPSTCPVTFTWTGTTSGGGDGAACTTLDNGMEIGLSHATTATLVGGNVTVSASPGSLGFGGLMMSASYGP
jgi:hypothetical protein